MSNNGKSHDDGGVAKLTSLRALCNTFDKMEISVDNAIQSGRPCVWVAAAPIHDAEPVVVGGQPWATYAPDGSNLFMVIIGRPDDKEDNLIQFAHAGLRETSALMRGEVKNVTVSTKQDDSQPLTNPALKLQSPLMKLRTIADIAYKVVEAVTSGRPMHDYGLVQPLYAALVDAGYTFPSGE